MHIQPLSVFASICVRESKALLMGTTYYQLGRHAINTNLYLKTPTGEKFFRESGNYHISQNKGKTCVILNISRARYHANNNNVPFASLKKKNTTSSILNYKTFDFFDIKFDHSSYLKICVKYHFFCRDLLY